MLHDRLAGQRRCRIAFLPNCETNFQSYQHHLFSLHVLHGRLRWAASDAVQLHEQPEEHFPAALGLPLMAWYPFLPACSAMQLADVYHARFKGEYLNSKKNLPHACKGRKEGRFTHPWQPARLIGWNSVWVGQCDISAMTSCQGRL